MTWTSTNGQRLFHLLPAVYRERDNGDLGAYLDVLGGVLDAIQHTLEQRMADNFPDTPPTGPVCQEWLLPYFAQLLDVRLASPDAAGRRAEIANAVFWRQAKGTLAVARQIAEAVGGMSVEVAEGWQRVAVTARVGLPLLPAPHFGEPPHDMTIPSEAARHPGLAAVTVDLRYPSRAVGSGPSGWRQGNPHGVPCFPGGYDDASRRTVDLRTPDWRQGHSQPRVLQLFAPPPPGFFPAGLRNIKWSERNRAEYRDLYEIREDEGRYAIVNTSGAPIRFTGPVVLNSAQHHLIDGFAFSTTVDCQSGLLELRNVAAPRVVAQHHGPEAPALSARNCLFRDVSAATGLMRLEYCTVLRKTVSEWLEASDCIFIRKPQKDHPTQPPPRGGCLRYCRVPTVSLGAVLVRECTTYEPLFFSNTFGAYGCGALHPGTHERIRHGAEDRGEMGAYHDRHYVLRAEAIVVKLQEYLPVGVEAVLIPDEHLRWTPPAAK